MHKTVIDLNKKRADRAISTFSAGRPVHSGGKIKICTIQKNVFRQTKAQQASWRTMKVAHGRHEGPTIHSGSYTCLKTDRPIVHILIFPPLQGDSPQENLEPVLRSKSHSSCRKHRIRAGATKPVAGGAKHRDKRKAPIAGGLTFGWCGI